MDAAETQFSTIGTVTQIANQQDKILTPQDLCFEGAAYIQSPESRPYYLAYNPDLARSDDDFLLFEKAYSIHIVEFILAEDYQSMGNLVKATVVRSVYNHYWHRYNEPPFGSKEKDLEAGDTFLFYQINTSRTPISAFHFEKGKRYIGNLSFNMPRAKQAGKPVYALRFGGAPFTSQYDPDTLAKIEDGRLSANSFRLDEVTEDFWEPGHPGEVWLKWIEQLKLWGDAHWQTVIPTNSTELLPMFHKKKGAAIYKGRNITEAEFSKGAKVCLVQSDFARANSLALGDTLRLPMSVAFYGFKPNAERPFSLPFYYDFSTLNFQGEPFEVFFEDEYEIVGFYSNALTFNSEIYSDSIIVPAKSITASDGKNLAFYGPMNNWGTSFQIPNGAIEEFDAALREAVPEAENLQIDYDDNGYGEVIDSLKSARLGPILLFAASLLAAFAVIVLLLYFFIFKERKRTAVERSLGMTKNQCRISLLSGIFVLSFLAVLAGSLAGRAAVGLLHQAESRTVSATAKDLETAALEDIPFSRDYSLWAKLEDSQPNIELGKSDMALQNAVCVFIPLLVLLAIVFLSLAAINKNLKMEPLTLLGRSNE